MWENIFISLDLYNNKNCKIIDNRVLLFSSYLYIAISYKCVSVASSTHDYIKLTYNFSNRPESTV
jgi:hypothetical protein